MYVFVYMRVRVIMYISTCVYVSNILTLSLLEFDFARKRLVIMNMPRLFTEADCAQFQQRGSRTLINLSAKEE